MLSQTSQSTASIRREVTLLFTLRCREVHGSLMLSRLRFAMLPLIAAPLWVSACGFRTDLYPEPIGPQFDSTAPGGSTDSQAAGADSAAASLDATGGTDARANTDLDATTDAALATGDAAAVADASFPFDGALPNGVQCDTTTCAVGQVCCVAGSGGGVNAFCASSCPSTDDAGTPIVALGCDGPEDCASTGNVCCVNVKLGAGAFPTCAIDSAGSSCKAASACPYALPFSCNATVSSKACATSSDCGAASPKCCDLSTLGIDSRMCTDALVASFLGGACN